MDNHFGGVIWTNHALERLRERGISQSDAWATWRRPDQSRPGSSDKGSWVYYKTHGSEKIEVVAKQNEKGEWVILSVWSKPVFSENQNANSQVKVKPLGRKIFELLFVKKENWK